MAIQKLSRYFKDIDLSFEPHPVTNDIPVLINERSINRSIRNLVETIPTERFFNSIIGSNIRGELFELSDFAAIITIKEQIENTIELFEPRVTDLTVQVDSAFDDNSFEVTVIYRIIGQDVPSQPFTFILEATR